MTRLTPISRAAIALAAVFAALLVCAFPRVASGDPISDKKAQAAAIAAKIDALNHTVEQYAERADAAQGDLDSINKQISDSQAKVAAAQAQVDQHQGELRTYAVDAYVRGGEDTEAEAVSGTADLTIQGQRAGYLSAAAGNRQQLIDQLSATQQ